MGCLPPHQHRIPGTEVRDCFPVSRLLNFASSFRCYQVEISLFYIQVYPGRGGTGNHTSLQNEQHVEMQAWVYQDFSAFFVSSIWLSLGMSGEKLAATMKPHQKSQEKLLDNTCRITLRVTSSCTFRSLTSCKCLLTETNVTSSHTYMN